MRLWEVLIYSDDDHMYKNRSGRLFLEYEARRLRCEFNKLYPNRSAISVPAVY